MYLLAKSEVASTAARHLNGRLTPGSTCHRDPPLQGLDQKRASASAADDGPLCRALSLKAAPLSSVAESAALVSLAVHQRWRMFGDTNCTGAAAIGAKRTQRYRYKMQRRYPRACRPSAWAYTYAAKRSRVVPRTA
ncbi:hypothetical protein MRX96_019084 [Rhipicephalus microplus]